MTREIGLRILFAGTPLFAAQHLSGLLNRGINVIGVISQPDKPGKRGKKNIPTEVKRIAEANGLPLIQPARLNPELIIPFDADLLIVVAFGQILRPEVLKAPRYGCINVHASLLPRWRGAAPIQRAILAGDQQTGVCIIQMDKSLDTGDILTSQNIPISDTDTSASLADKLTIVGIDALTMVLGQLGAGTCRPYPQSGVGVTYARKVEKIDALCTWQKSSLEISRMIRAFFPTPVAYAYLDQLRVKFHQATVLESAGQQGVPGEVLNVCKDGVAVACGEGSLLLERLQLTIGKGSILSGRDIINSRSSLISVGTRFSSQYHRPGNEPHV